MGTLDNASAIRVKPVCIICSEDAKYRCPACERRTCSAACVAQHKTEYGCSGKRPRADYVAPLAAFTNHIVERDFAFLEEVDCAVDRAHREFGDRSAELRLYNPKRHAQRVALSRLCAEEGRQTCLTFAPAAMAVSRRNSSHVVDGKVKGGAKGSTKGAWKGRGKYKKSDDWRRSAAPSIVWHVEWHFARCDQVLVDRSLPEREVIASALSRFLENRCGWGATKHLLSPYVTAGLENIEVFLQEETPPVTTRRDLEDYDEDDAERWVTFGGGDCSTGIQRVTFRRLDKSRSLRENLVGCSIVEYPVLHVALQQELERFCTKKETPTAPFDVRAPAVHVDGVMH